MLNKLYVVFNKSEKIEKYLTSYTSLLIQFIFFFLAWYFNNRGFVYFALPTIVLITCLFSYNSTYLCHLLVFDMISYRQLPASMNGDLPFSILFDIVVIILGFVIMYIKRLVLEKKFNFSFGCMGISLTFLAFICLLSSIINHFTYNTNYSSLGFLISGLFVGLIIVYLLMVNTSLRDNNDFINKIMYFFFIGIIAQMLTLNVIKGIGIKFITGSNEKGGEEYAWLMMDLGWSISRNIATIGLEICMPFVLAIFNKDKKRVDCLALFIIGLILTIFSWCRGSLLTILVLLFMYCFIVVYNQKSFKSTIKKGLLIYSGIIAIGLIVMLTVPKFKAVIDNTLSTLGDSSGRDRLWEVSMSYYSRSPIIGSSFSCLYDLGDVFNGIFNGNGSMFCLAHNTFVNLLAVAGVLGVIGYLLNIFETIFSSVLYPKKELVLPLVTFVLIGLVHGIVDNTFFSLAYFIPLMILFSRKEEINVYDLYMLKKASKKETCIE